MKKVTRFIGLTGTNGAGKGEVAAYLKEKGFSYISLSDLIREELGKRREEITRDNLIKTGNQLRKKYGSDILARLALKKVKGKTVIDSIRNPEEIKYLSQNRGFTLLAVDAPVELRYERAKKRGREESASTLQEFKEKETEEMATTGKGQQLLNCMQLADFTIINDGSLQDLHQKLEGFL